jgi:hypothetical protein
MFYGWCINPLKLLANLIAIDDACFTITRRNAFARDSAIPLSSFERAAALWLPKHAMPGVSGFANDDDELAATSVVNKA